jgi:signal transduction histidine kinase
MSHLTLVSANRALGQAPAASAAHDLRNLLATIALHIETLGRLAGPPGAKAASAAHALTAKAAMLCNSVIDGAGSDSRIRQRSVDAVHVIRQVADLVRPAAPEELTIDIGSNGTAMTLADPGDVFRIVFNLVNNAVALARQTGRLTRIEARVERQGATVAIRVADDGPGLPAAVRSNLIRSPETSRDGHGLAIARELAERNGGTLSLDPTPAGTAFVVTLPAFVAMLVENGPVTRSLGQRVAR